MKNETYSDLVTPDLVADAIENDEFPGFLQDYHVIHVLLQKYRPKSVLEIGTNLGRGTSIICNALPDAEVYSLDLPTELAHKSLQHPISEGKGDKVGCLCKFPFTQLRGDSMKFDFSQYPCEAYYDDGDHTYENVFHETKEMLKHNPKLIIWHDADIPEVWKAITDALSNEYRLHRVTDTRIAYAVRQ